MDGWSVRLTATCWAKSMDGWKDSQSESSMATWSDIRTESWREIEMAGWKVVDWVILSDSMTVRPTESCGSVKVVWSAHCLGDTAGV